MSVTRQNNISGIKSKLFISSFFELSIMPAHGQTPHAACCATYLCDQYASAKIGSLESCTEKSTLRIRRALTDLKRTYGRSSTGAICMWTTARWRRWVDGQQSSLWPPSASKSHSRLTQMPAPTLPRLERQLWLTGVPAAMGIGISLCTTAEGTC